MNYRASADYLHIDAALKSFWQPFTDLEREMDSFSPRPLAEFEDQRRRLLEQYRTLNPRSSDESLIKLVDGQVSLAASYRVQFTDEFSRRFMTQYVTIAFLSHALCEAVINAMLAIGLVEHGSKELFRIIEKADIKDKWSVGPKCFCPSYELKKGTALFDTLDRLTKRRNALVHNKIELHVDGQKVLEGSRFERESFKDGNRWLRRFFGLPYDLEANFHNQMEKPLISILPSRLPIEIAKAHRLPEK